MSYTHAERSRHSGPDCAGSTQLDAFPQVSLAAKCPQNSADVIFYIVNRRVQMPRCHDFSLTTATWVTEVLLLPCAYRHLSWSHLGDKGARLQEGGHFNMVADTDKYLRDLRDERFCLYGDEEGALPLFFRQCCQRMSSCGRRVATHRQVSPTQSHQEHWRSGEGHLHSARSCSHMPDSHQRSKSSLTT